MTDKELYNYYKDKHKLLEDKYSTIYDIKKSFDEMMKLKLDEIVEKMVDAEENANYYLDKIV